MDNNSNKVPIGSEWLDGYQMVNTNWYKDGICKRCGKSFTKKYKKQIFCSRECVSDYRINIKGMKDEYGDEFSHWLNDSTDYSYAPERF